MMFLDTEFYRSPRGPRLLSIGLVDAKDEFYAELDPASLQRIGGLRRHRFHQAQVLVQFGRMALSQAPLPEIADRIVRWLNERGRAVLEVAYDYNVDYLLLERLVELSGRTLAVRLEPVHVGC